jgi:hypothetical protein
MSYSTQIIITNGEKEDKTIAIKAKLSLHCLRTYSYNFNNEIFVGKNHYIQFQNESVKNNTIIFSAMNYTDVSNAYSKKYVDFLNKYKFDTKNVGPSNARDQTSPTSICTTKYDDFKKSLILKYKSARLSFDIYRILKLTKYKNLVNKILKLCYYWETSAETIKTSEVKYLTGWCKDPSHIMFRNPTSPPQFAAISSTLADLLIALITYILGKEKGSSVANSYLWSTIQNAYAQGSSECVGGMYYPLSSNDSRRPFYWKGCSGDTSSNNINECQHFPVTLSQQLIWTTLPYDILAGDIEKVTFPMDEQMKQCYETMHDLLKNDLEPTYSDTFVATNNNITSDDDLKNCIIKNLKSCNPYLATILDNLLNDQDHSVSNDSINTAASSIINTILQTKAQGLVNDQIINNLVDFYNKDCGWHSRTELRKSIPFEVSSTNLCWLN